MTDAHDPDPVDAEAADTGPADAAAPDTGPAAGGPDGGDRAPVDAVHPAVDEARRDVAAALAALADAEGRPAAEQVAAFEQAHETLQAALARIDEH